MSHQMEAEELLVLIEMTSDDVDTKAARAQIHATLAVAHAIRQQTAAIKAQTDAIENQTHDLSTR